MTPTGLRKALLELGWHALLRRGLGVRPAEAHALIQLLRWPGRPVTIAELADEYAGPGTTGSVTGVRKRVERVRRALTDMGCENAIQSINGEGAYIIQKPDVSRIEKAILFACGIDLQDDGEINIVEVVA